MKKFLAALTITLAIPTLPVYAETTITSTPEITQTVYTASELQIAKNKISENRELFGITSISTSVKDNSIVVTAQNWDENQKKEIIKIAGIQNIIFKLSDATTVDDTKTYYEIALNTPKITINNKETKDFTAPFVKNGIYMLPLSDILTISGYTTNINYDEKRMDTKIGNSIFSIDIQASKFFFNAEERPLLVEPLLKDGHCYVSYNDLKDFISIKNLDDTKNTSFFWELTDKTNLEDMRKATPIKNIYKFTAGSSMYYKNGTSKKISGTVYKKGTNLMIPIRTIAETMSDNTTVSWNDTKKSALIKSSGKTYEFLYNTSTINANSSTFALPVPLELINGRLYVPSIDCLTIQYYLGNKMDTFDIYQADENTFYIRM